MFQWKRHVPYESPAACNIEPDAFDEKQSSMRDPKNKLVYETRKKLVCVCIFHNSNITLNWCIRTATLFGWLQCIKTTRDNRIVATNEATCTKSYLYLSLCLPIKLSKNRFFRCKMNFMVATDSHSIQVNIRLNKTNAHGHIHARFQSNSRKTFHLL